MATWLVAVATVIVAPVAGGAPSRSELDERLVQLERIVENQGLQRLELARRLEALPVSGEWTPELARAWWEAHQPASS